ncbi:MAG: hypothetical protein HXS52_13215 [Theionarchaea archaeon]|nr:hypothetical protein [Theionarchaea archaeon]MBU7038885.1 hypothetical protein [Theionarchaea archaeon]
MLSICILLSINIYFSVCQFLGDGFIETDMWFFAYRIEEIAEKGAGSLFVTPYGSIDVHPPLYYAITVPLKKIGLPVLWIAALLRIITPLTVIYFLYKTTDLLFDKTSAAVACFLMALMPLSGSYHGLWTSTPSAVSLIPFSAGLFATVKFSTLQTKKWFFSAITFLLLASLIHMLTAFASFVFLGCALFIFRKKVPRLFTFSFIIVFIILSVYGLRYFSSIADSESLLDILRKAFGPPSARKISVLRQLFFIAYWPRHFTLLASVSFCIAVSYFCSKKIVLRAVDKVFFAWAIILVVYSQLFLVGIFLSNQRFLLYLLFPVCIYGGYGFVRGVMPVLKKNTFWKFSYLISILLFSMYPIGVALVHFPAAIRSDDVHSLEELSTVLPEGTVYVQNWFHNGRYLFSYTTGHRDMAWDITLATDLHSVLASAGVDYIVTASRAEANSYMNAPGGDISLMWTDKRFYLLKVRT